MNWPRKRILALVLAVACMGVLGTFAVLQAVVVQSFPNILRFKVKDPVFIVRGPTIVLPPIFETSLGSTTEFALLVDNGDGPINGQISFIANVTGWTEDPNQVTFAYRFQINGTYLNPSNECPHAQCVLSYLFPQGPTVFRGTIEIGSLAPIQPFEIQMFLTKG